MHYEKEISANGKNWQKVTLYSAMPISKKSRYVITIRNLVILGFRNLVDAKKYRKKLRKELRKLGVLMDLTGLSIRIYCVREVKKPDYERNAIDAQFEVLS